MLLLGGLGRGLGDQPLLCHQVDHQVAARFGALGVAPRIIVGGALDHADHQRDLVQLQLAQRLAEQVLAGHAETVDGTLARLPQVDFVEIGFKDLLLAVMQLQQYRHHRLHPFAQQVAVIVEVEVFHQLLGDGAAPLHRGSRLDIGDQGPQDGLG